MRTAIGIDAGGTSTRAVWVREDAVVLGVGFAGPGNPLSAGPGVAVESWTAAIRQALQAQQHGADPAEFVVLAIAGGAAESELAELRSRLLPGLDAEVLVASDILGAYFAGRSDPAGYIVVSGTGAIAGRIEGGELVRVSDGLGWLLGDEGSGYWLGHQGARAAMRAIDGRGPATALTHEFIAKFKSESFSRRAARSADVSAVLEQVYRHQRPVELARFARVVLRHAATDQVAGGLVAEAAGALLDSWRSVQREPVTGTVLAGGILSQPGALQDLVAAGISGEVTVVTSGLVGAGVLALKELGVQCTDGGRRSIATSIDQLAGEAGSRG